MLQHGKALESRLRAPVSPRALRSTAPPLRAAPEPHAGYNAAKRALDIVVAAVALVIALPVTALAGLLIFVTTGQQPLLRQRRAGRLGREFTMLKLRTMRPAMVDDGPRPLLTKQRRDARVTPVGRVLRRTSIDELPQLVNVLLGQMSLVGPRPALPEEVAQYPSSWRRRLAVKPGLSGLWQVSGRSSVPARRWMAMDRYYVGHRSLAFDLAILARTVAAVVSLRGAW